MIILSLWTPVWAFCGAYVGDGETQLTNTTSQIAIARSGTATTLTMFNDYQGDLATFGLLVPVPAGVDADNVRLVDRAVLTKLDGYSSPRLVSYTCDDWYGISDAAVASGTSSAKAAAAVAAPPATSTSSGGCGGGSSWFDSGTSDTASVRDSGVVIEDEFELGEYTAWVVSSEGLDGLSAWLESQGFVVDAITEAALQGYIDAGSHFLALRVDLERLDDDQWLSPLQIGYDAEAWTLPIKLGAASSAGVQDLVVYAVTGPSAGQVGVSNYTETPPAESDCLAAVESSFSEWYEQGFEAASGLPADPEALAGRQGFAWTTEYGWGAGKCDPCTDTGELTFADIEALGFPNAAYGWHFTRLHLRYTPESVTEDLTFYESGIVASTQVRFVADTWELRAELPTCGEADPAVAAACYSAEYWERKADEDALGTHAIDDDFSACPGGSAGLLLLPLALLWRRRA